MRKVLIDTYYQDLKNFQIEGGTITSIQTISLGSFSQPGGGSITDLPAFCRVMVNLKPTPSSNINIELWLPQNNWNGRFLGTGNGGSAGSIAYDSLAFGLLQGYVTANTDMGTSPNADFAIGKPERWADFGYRATHEMTVVAKKLIQIYYRKPAVYSYFVGCSTGGQQALMEAQRYPADYNGIIAGVPANNRTHLHTSFLWNYKAMNQVSGSALLPKNIEAITKSVVLQWQGKDGGAPSDNFLTDPRNCNFEPGNIQNYECDGLTCAQINALKQVYKGPTNPTTGERIYTPIPFGSENSMLGLDYQQDPEHLPDELLYPFRWVFGYDFDYTMFDFDKDLDTLNEKLALLLNANNPDLSAMKELGGKILMFSGTADPLVPFQDALNYYERVVKEQHGITQTQDFFRYFLVPGMGHCGEGSPGLNHIGLSIVQGIPQDSEHDVLHALVEWVEEGKTPDKIIGSAFDCGISTNDITFQRPIFPYPKFPKYVCGDPNLPSSYQGVDRLRSNVLKPDDRYII